MARARVRRETATVVLMTTAAETPDEELVRGAQSGNGEATELLLARYQPWGLQPRCSYAAPPRRRGGCHAGSADQSLQALPTFRGDCKFRTWLYRIAVNHILNVKKASAAVCSFDDAARGLERVPDLDLPDPRTVPVPVEILVEEAKIGCTMGTLLCLDGRQRLVFILGEIFGVSDEVGAEIVEVTPVNFRQILSRARRDLYEYLRGNCSLVNPDAPAGA